MKKKRTYDSHSRKVKGIGQGIITAKAISITPIPTRSKDKTGTPLRKLSPDAIMAMARDKAAGATASSLSDKYGVSTSYINEALKTLFVSNAVGREVLKGVLLDNAIATGMQARAKISELSPMQSVAAAAVFTSKFIDIDKHDKDTPKDIDVSTLAKMSDDVDKLVQGLCIEDKGESVL